MPGKYRIEGVFTLNSEIEPEGRLGGVEDAEGVTDYEDSSSWDTASFTVEGGTVDFTVEANSEDEARDLAQAALDGAYFSEYGGFAWEISDYSISNIECIEEPWDMERALTVIRAFLTRMREMGGVNAEEEEAFRFFLDEITP